jgi:hypothetical protein
LSNAVKNLVIALAAVFLFAGVASTQITGPRGGTGSGSSDASLAEQQTQTGHLATIAAAATVSSMERYISDGLTEDENEIKASAGVLDSIAARNSHSTNAAYLKCTNLTEANTTPGTSPIFYEMVIPPASGFIDASIITPFSTALTCYIVLGKADNAVDEVAANDVSYTIRYR